MAHNATNPQDNSDVYNPPLPFCILYNTATHCNNKSPISFRFICIYYIRIYYINLQYKSEWYCILYNTNLQYQISNMFFFVYSTTHVCIYIVLEICCRVNNTIQIEWYCLLYNKSPISAFLYTLQHFAFLYSILYNILPFCILYNKSPISFRFICIYYICT